MNVYIDFQSIQIRRSVHATDDFTLQNEAAVAWNKHYNRNFSVGLPVNKFMTQVYVISLKSVSLFHFATLSLT